MQAYATWPVMTFIDNCFETPEPVKPLIYPRARFSPSFAMHRFCSPLFLLQRWTDNYYAGLFP